MIRVNFQRAQDQRLGFALQALALFHRQRVGVVGEQMRIVRRAFFGIGVRRNRIVKTPHHRVRFAEHGPALRIVRILLHALGEFGHHGFHLSMCHAFAGIGRNRRGRQGTRIAHGEIQRYRHARQHKAHDDGRRAAARCRGCWRCIVRADIIEQALFEFHARTLILLIAQRAGAAIGLQFRQLIAIHGDIERLRGRRRTLGELAPPQ